VTDVNRYVSGKFQRRKQPNKQTKIVPMVQRTELPITSPCGGFGEVASRLGGGEFSGYKLIWKA